MLYCTLQAIMEELQGAEPGEGKADAGRDGAVQAMRLVADVIPAECDGLKVRQLTNGLGNGAVQPIATHVQTDELRELTDAV
jgi:hypothetical protein